MEKMVIKVWLNVNIKTTGVTTRESSSVVRHRSKMSEALTQSRHSCHPLLWDNGWNKEHWSTKTDRQNKLKSNLRSEGHRRKTIHTFVTSLKELLCEISFLFPYSVRDCYFNTMGECFAIRAPISPQSHVASEKKRGNACVCMYSMSVCEWLL